MLANSSQIYFSQHQTQLVPSQQKSQDISEVDQYDQILSTQAFQIRSQRLCQYDENSNSWIQLKGINTYNTKIARFDNQIFFVGGSLDP